MTTIERTKSSPWLADSTMEPLDIGSCTLPIICQRLDPSDWAASTVVAETLADSVGGDLDGDRGGVQHGGNDRQEPASGEERQRWHQVDQGGHGLQTIEQRPDRCVDAAAAPHPDADEDAEDHHKEGGDQGHGERRHRVVPEADGKDEGKARGRGDQGAPTTQGGRPDQENQDPAPVEDPGDVERVVRPVAGGQDGCSTQGDGSSQAGHGHLAGAAEQDGHGKDAHRHQPPR